MCICGVPKAMVCASWWKVLSKLQRGRWHCRKSGAEKHIKTVPKQSRVIEGTKTEKDCKNGRKKQRNKNLRTKKQKIK